MSEHPQRDSGFGNPPPQNSSVVTTSASSYTAPKKLSSFMATNIALISVVGLASILLMFFGEFEGKVSRVIGTLLLFAAFTTFTAMDTNKDKPSRHMFVSQAGNIYMLALGLVLIWGTIGAIDFDEFEIIPKLLFLILIIKVGVILLQKISDYVSSEQQQLSFASFLSGIAIAGATILFTLPIGLGHIFEFGEGYWKLGVGILMFGGLTISITALLAWFFKEKTDAPMFPSFQKSTAPEPQHHVALTHAPQQPVAAPPVASQRPPAPVGTDSPAPVVNAPAGAPQFAPPVKGALSWPVFPNGFPLPAKPNGRPNFEALKEMSEMYIEGERQFFG